ncbi:hypothetical protein AB0I51_20640 [Streptomyces sp. NPDC050549]|uniref:hypothetical protein n=1 Tax=Streptomyces sp. NPDC050549 TaxID=3155406 RepID=UPI0034305D0B
MTDTPLEGLVFCQPDGSPLRPQGILTELRRRSEELGLPRIGVHDLRHSTLSTTVNLYGHLLPYAARDAVTAIDKALARADRKHHQTAPASEDRAA